MDMSRRTAGLGLLVYGLGTAVAFMTIDAPGGDYEDAVVTAYVAGSHLVPAFVLAYVGASAALGLMPFAAWLRRELPSGGDVFWGLAVAGSAAGVIGWFLLGGIAVVAAEGGDALTALPHPVIYALGELGILVGGCASAFFVGSAALVLSARGPLPTAVRIVTAVAGACGLLAAFFFPLFLFWIWAIGFGLWVATTGTRESRRVEAQPQPM
jgi:hypothetical protein